MSKSDSGSADSVQLAIYRSVRHDMMYLYVPAILSDQNERGGESSDHNCQHHSSADLSVLPEALLERFGPPEYRLTIDLWPGRKLAQADSMTVLAAIDQQGFYLQMPPTLTLPETPDARNVGS